jgi:Tfp pilus assembly protein FimT
MLVMGIVASLAVPSITASIDILKLKADAHQMAEALRAARQDAITSGQVSRVVFYAGGNRYKVYNSSSSLPVTRWLNKGIVVLGMPTFTQRMGGNPVCAFYPSGAPSSGGTVILKNSRNKKLYIIVNPAVGRIRVSDTPPEHW